MHTLRHLFRSCSESRVEQRVAKISPSMVSFLESANRQSFRDAKCHSDTFRAIANICFEVAVYSKPEAVTSELNTRTETNGPLL
jgi:hypothetical protein